MSKIFSALIGASFAALALSASAQTTTPTAPSTAAVQSQNPAALTTADKKPVMKAKHHKAKKAKAKVAAVK